ncbi:EamA domain-containing protein [Cephalotus follicularis]|uniref:WAT1-related protein n=1 Tax=Cephalotus follicularis TaxID=3775 RepID=A0A1Q3BNC1_CEPFO|nr:EamA domain-containing protein [Cephalotus follicularis]
MAWFDKPTLIIVGLQFIYAGFILFTKRAFAIGLNPRMFDFYRQLFATLSMIPVCYLSRRNAPMGTSVGLKGLGYIFVAALFGLTGNQNLYFEGVELASSTIGGAMVNLIPAITFVIATTLGLEKINLKSFTSLAKILGTIICVTGAVIMTLLKGPELFSASLRSADWLYGSLFCFAGACCFSIWLILQVPVAKYCPDNKLSTLWMNFFGTLQAAVVALIVDRELKAWELHSTFIIVGLICCGVGSSVSIIGQAYCVTRRGPVFSAMFNPLTTVIVVVLAAIFLQDKVYIASLLGAIVMIAGLYIVLWGKSRDRKEGQESNQMPQIDETTTVQVDLEEPFLSNRQSPAA